MKKLALILLALIGCAKLFAQGPSLRVPDADAPNPGTAWYYYKNKGQIIDKAQNIRNDIKYYTDHPGVRIYLGADTISFTGHNWGIVDDTLRSDTSFRLDMQFFCSQRDANQPCSNTIATYEPSGDSLNYYLPHCSAGIEGVPGYGGVVYQNAFPNTDVHFFSNPDGPVTYFVFHPTADTNDFALLFNGQDSIQTTANYLHAYVGAHDIWFPDGIAYQVDPLGNILPLTWIPTWYKVNSGMVKMQFGSYNSSYDLVIRTGQVGQITAGSGTDNLIWTTYYGDPGSEANPDSSRKWSVDGMPIIKSSLGNGQRVVYHTMTTNSTAFDITTGNRIDTTGMIRFKGNYDCIVSSFDGDSCRRLWATYYGGSDYEEVGAMLIMDATLPNNNMLGNLLLGGRSRSSDIPFGAWATYLGWHKSTNIPSGNGNTGSFMASFGASNGRLKYGTYFGGGSHFYLDGLAWDNYKQEIVFSGYVHGDFSIVDTTGLTPGRDTISLRRATGRYYQATNPDYESAFLGSFDLSRNLVWSTLIGGNALDVINVVVPDKTGGLYALGNTLSNSNGLNVSGAPIIAPTNTGANVTLPFVNPGKSAFFQTNPTTRTGFVIHFNRNRAIDWGTLFGGGTDNEFLGIGVTSNNDLYIAGMTVNADTFYSSSADNGPTTHRIPTYDAIGSSYMQTYGSTSGGHNTGTDAVIARFDSTHRLRWSTLFGRAGTERAPIRLVVDHANHVYMLGNNEIDTNAGAGAQGIPIYTVAGRYQQDSNASSRSLLSPTTINSKLEASDGWIVQFNPNNQPVWSTLYGGVYGGKHAITAGNYRDAREILTSMDATTNNGLVSLYMTGVSKNPNTPMFFSNTARRKPYSNSYDDQTHAGSWDAFMGMFDNARATSVPIVTQEQSNSTITVAPNPSHDRFTVTFNNESGNSRMQMIVTNAFGQTMLSGDINAVFGANKLMLDLGQLPAGIYFVQIASKDKSETARMIKY